MFSFFSRKQKKPVVEVKKPVVEVKKHFVEAVIKAPKPVVEIPKLVKTPKPVEISKPVEVEVSKLVEVSEPVSVSELVEVSEPALKPVAEENTEDMTSDGRPTAYKLGGAGGGLTVPVPRKHGKSQSAFVSCISLAALENQMIIANRSLSRLSIIPPHQWLPVR